jgi:hopanoid-associated phosphorylase
MEARIALGPGVAVICEQGWRLVAALEAAVARGAAGIISFGIAGGLAPELVAGDFIVGAAVMAGPRSFPTDEAWARQLLRAMPHARYGQIVGMDAPIASAAEKQQLHARTGAVAVDNESHIAARIAAAHRLPFAACRTVIDSARTDLPPAAMVGLRHDGTPDLRAILLSLAQQPAQLALLVRIGRDLIVARRALQHGRQRLNAGLSFPYLGEHARGTVAHRRAERVLSLQGAEFEA